MKKKDTLSQKDKEDWNEGDMSGGRFSVLFERDNLTTQFSSTFAKNEQDGYIKPDTQ